PTWSTSSAIICRSPGARRRSKLCAPSCSKSAPASARPPVVSAFTSPAAGPFRLCSTMRCWRSTPVKLLDSVSNPFLSAVQAEPCPKNKPASHSPRFLGPQSSARLATTRNLKKPCAKTENLSSHELSRLDDCNVYDESSQR